MRSAKLLRRLTVSGAATIAALGVALLLGAPAAQANGGHRGYLFAGTDDEEFHGSRLGPDRLGRFRTRGPNVVSGTIITTSYPINGMTDARGFLYSGDPYSNVIRRISYSGSLRGSIVAAFPPACCSEDMVFDGRFLYHAHFSAGAAGVIERINPRTGALIQTYPQRDVVGMTFVTKEDDDDDDDDDDRSSRFARLASPAFLLWSRPDHRQIWITKWAGRQVGTWDPATNTFTPRFATPDRAGGLAWDEKRKVLWVGLRGGLVVPYRLNGTPYNTGFRPFGPISDTIDGLEFVKNIHRHHHHR
jgi:hypothetical protein